jgi:hypothetical protein
MLQPFIILDKQYFIIILLSIICTKVALIS